MPLYSIRIAAVAALMAILLMIPSSSHARAREEQEGRDGIEDLISEILPAGKVSIYAEPVASDNALVNIDGGEMMPPASCVKMITGAAALSELGVDYRFSTEFLSDTKPSGTSIANLYIRGNGDPFITPDALWKMAGAFNDHGIHRIEGDVVIDQSFFEGYDYPHKDSGNSHAYEAPTAAVAANFNVVEFIVAPGHRRGAPAHIAINPPAPYVKLINKVKTGNRVRISARKVVSDDHETFTVFGETKPGAKLTTVAKSISHPAKYAGSLFADFLSQNNVEFRGKTREGKVPDRAYPLFEVPSRPLALLVRDMNKFSSNFIAEQITKHLGKLRSGKPGNTSRGLKAIREWLRSIGIKPYEYVLENGSGLSGKSQFSAKQLVRVLKAAWKDPAIAPDFMSSLSILGVDGTMQQWQAEPELRGILRAKTGTLRGVATLAGFIPDKQGNLIAFAIMAEDLDIGIFEARDAEVKIARIIAESR